MAKFSNNIVHFPIKIKPQSFPTQPKNVEEVEDNIDMIKHFHIQETIEAIIPFLFDRLTLAGFELNDENESDIKYGAFVCEAIRSLLLNKYDIEHTFQIFADKLFVEDKDGYISMVENANIIIKLNSDLPD